MTSNRDSFLQRIRDAVKAGNRPGAAPALEPRGATGYQGAGTDPLATFCEAFRNAGGQPYIVADTGAAVERVLQIVQEKAAHKVLLGRGEVLDSLDLRSRLAGAGLEVFLASRERKRPEEAPHAALPPVAYAPGSPRDEFFAAEVGISGADYLVAETGSIIALARPDEPRSLSLLPPVHIVVATRAALLPDLFDLFAALGAEPGAVPNVPSCLTIITGPSKTGDIELKLVTGVHGPGEVHAVLVSS
jgi:L-lactate dehydrogenase complex protein LldG